ncbi:MAG TPA: FlgD immunoglobulin-like domain containing protein [Actinomycetota bacterium]|nr:FlgD immunoglobulin-like domain containing protein [Actinomycetota bacterium]
MRRTASCLVLALLAGFAAAVPASAAISAVVDVPAAAAYSPYVGPATVTFTFGSDASDVFRVRIRQPGHPTPIKEKDVLVDPATQTSPHAIAFSWPAISVTKPTNYVVDVRRQSGGPVITSTTVTVLPPLVSAVSVAPSPFYPFVQDGYRDRTTVSFALASDTTDTTLHLYAGNAYGRCCGTEIRTEDLGTLAAGTYHWIWDGTEGDTSAAPKGAYFVRVAATDTGAVSMVAPAKEVDVARGLIRRTATKQKAGSAYIAAKGQPTASGGYCQVMRTGTTHQAYVLCSNAQVSVTYGWGLGRNERLEKVSFVTANDGYYRCYRKFGHTPTRSFVLVHAPPTSGCYIVSAKVTYSYPYHA